MQSKILLGITGKKRNKTCIVPPFTELTFWWVRQTIKTQANTHKIKAKTNKAL